MNQQLIGMTVAPARERSYPETIHLRDGAELIIRPIRVDDAHRLQAHYMRLSSKSAFFRFISRKTEYPIDEVIRLATVDYQTDMAFVATQIEDGEEQIVGVVRYHGMYAPNDVGLAEMAIVVEDAYHRRGLGAILFDRLLDYARTHKFHSFLAIVHPSNSSFLRFLESTGLPVKKKLDCGLYDVIVKLFAD